MVKYDIYRPGHVMILVQVVLTIQKFRNLGTVNRLKNPTKPNPTARTAQMRRDLKGGKLQTKIQLITSINYQLSCKNITDIAQLVNLVLEDRLLYAW